MPGEHERPVFDVAAFARQTGGDADLRQEIIGMFLEDCPVRVAAVRAAVEQRDAPALVSAAHSLKGICGYLSAVAAREQAAHLEQIGRLGRLDEDEAESEAAAALARLDAAIAELIPELRKHYS
jgi:HPt (histidine-containing phosphotransfer) domain-containing protein